MHTRLHASRISRRTLLLVGTTLAIALTVGMWSSVARGAGVSGKSAAAVGRFTFADIQGKTYGTPDIAAHKATVFVFVSAQCPVSNAYSSRIAALADDAAKRGAQVFAVYSNRQESLSDVTRHARARGFHFPVVRDTNNALADRLGASMTPQAIVVDASATVRYRGRIDDNAVATHVTSHDLSDAIDAVLAGRSVAHPQTLAFGCSIRRTGSQAPVVKGAPTYARDVAAILRAKCENCHRPGEVAPFSLQTYQQASAWATDIKKYTQNRQMPPWKPAAGYGEFLEEHSRNLSDAERATLAKWADAGAPLGDAKRIPPPRHFTQGWQSGQPDLVLMPDRDYHLAADGDDVYRNFVVKTNFKEDRYVSAVEIRPGNRAVVHHVLNFVDARGASDKLDGKDKDGEPGYTTFGGVGFVPTGMLGGWAPGNEARLLPDGIGMYVPKGARIVIQVHYHKDGKPETDRTRIGLHFARATVDKQIYNPMVLNWSFRIPPGESHYEATAEMPITQDIHVQAVSPHMHLLGREMKVWATLPNGTDIPLVWIKDWDFNWQATYFLKTPIALPKGSHVHLTAYYDNSPNNPRNPNRAHPKTVTWGEQTTDEMCIAFISLTRDAEHLAARPGSSPAKTAQR